MSDGPPTLARTVGQLSTSVWAYAALGTLIESGVLERLQEPQTAERLAHDTQLDVPLVKALLEVGVALVVIEEKAGAYVARFGVIDQLQSAQGRGQQLFIRSDVLQTGDLLRRAHAGTLKPGWHYTDPDILHAQGIGSGAVMEALCRDVVPTLDGLHERLRAPGAEFLDVGAGVGAICITLARLYPSLRIVGLEPAAVPLKEAQRSIAASGFGQRIEVRPIRLDQLTDTDRFDAGWLPQVFLPLDVLERSIGPFYRSIKPGGWGILFALAAEGGDLGPAISRFRNVLWGGEPHAPAAIAQLVAAAGFQDIRLNAAGGIANASLIIGRKPSRRLIRRVGNDPPSALDGNVIASKE